MRNPLPSVNPPPVCPRMFGCMVNEASTFHINSPLLSAPKIRGQSRSPLWYSIRWHSLSQLSLSGALTLVARNAIAKHVSGLALLVTYRVFDTIVWKSAGAASNNLSQSSFTTNKLSRAFVLNRCFVTGMNPSPCFSSAASNACQIPSK
jgi:hypothetical protein